MVGQTGAANPDRIIGGAGTPALLRELRKSNRRRVRLDPASKFENPWTIGGQGGSLPDALYGATITEMTTVPVRP